MMDYRDTMAWQRVVVTYPPTDGSTVLPICTANPARVGLIIGVGNSGTVLISPDPALSELNGIQLQRGVKDTMELWHHSSGALCQVAWWNFNGAPLSFMLCIELIMDTPPPQ